MKQAEYAVLSKTRGICTREKSRLGGEKGGEMLGLVVGYSG
jgi:hypothetical protein